MSSKLENFLGSKSPWIMGILNITPNSFSDAGSFLSPESALAQAEALLSSGAHLLDIGGESTGPGQHPVSEQVELSRILPIVAAFSSKAFVSIDTYKSGTARCALELGAKMINDVSALRADAEMAAVVRDYDCFVVLMHSKEKGEHPHAISAPHQYRNIVQDVGDFLESRIDFALSRGIAVERLVLDPGMGCFLSSLPEYSWELLRKLPQLIERFPELPFLVGTSRKSFLGGKLQARDPVSQLTALAALEKGAAIVRTHNPGLMRSFVETWNAVN